MSWWKRKYYWKTIQGVIEINGETMAELKPQKHKRCWEHPHPTKIKRSQKAQGRALLSYWLSSMWVEERSQCLPMNAAEFLLQQVGPSACLHTHTHTQARTCTHSLFICTHAAILSTNIWSFQLTVTVRQHLTSHSIKGPARLCSSLISFFFYLFFLTGNLRLPFLNQRSSLPCMAHSHSRYMTKNGRPTYQSFLFSCYCTPPILLPSMGKQKKGRDQIWQGCWQWPNWSQWSSSNSFQKLCARLAHIKSQKLQNFYLQYFLTLLYISNPQMTNEGSILGFTFQTTSASCGCLWATPAQFWF